MSDAGRLDPIGGQRALDFLNTLAAIETPAEKLHSYAELPAWSERAAVLTTGAASRLGDLADADPAQAAAALAGALQLRERRAVLRAQLVDDRPPERSLAPIRDAHTADLSHATPIPAEDGCHWTWAT